jgi:uncharacterized membrane protein
MLKFLAAYGCSALVVAVMDGAWLTIMGDKLYRPVLGDFMSKSVNLSAAVAFYLIYLAGLTFLATWPALREASIGKAVLNGAIFGLVAYATYDLTNQATLTRWSTTITLADMGWGTVMSLIAAAAGYYGSRFLVK